MSNKSENESMEIRAALMKQNGEIVEVIGEYEDGYMINPMIVNTPVLSIFALNPNHYMIPLIRTTNATKNRIGVPESWFMNVPYEVDEIYKELYIRQSEHNPSYYNNVDDEEDQLLLEEAKKNINDFLCCKNGECRCNDTGC